MGIFCNHSLRFEGFSLVPASLDHLAEDGLLEARNDCRKFQSYLKLLYVAWPCLLSL